MNRFSQLLAHDVFSNVCYIYFIFISIFIWDRHQLGRFSLLVQCGTQLVIADSS